MTAPHQKLTPKPLPMIAEYGPYAIDVKDLTFGYNTTGDLDKVRTILHDLNLTLKTGSRCLLIGANGSGKSTLLRILAGRHLTQTEVKVLGLNAFRDTKLNFHTAYLDVGWGMTNVAFVGAAVPMMADIPVHKMMEKLQNSYPERRDELVTMLGIDLNWRMHQLSDGQRRRVQILLGLVRPFKILLLDEITTSLDVCVRQDLLKWLVRESDERGATIIYATHIFDGLDDWASHLFYLTNHGKCGWQGTIEELDYYQKLKAENHPCKMLAVAEHWLRKEMEESRARNEFEKAQYAEMELDPTDRQGGYASGRGIPLQDADSASKKQRQGRLSDMLGNAGKMDTHHQTAA
jgi:CCR4-NOT complex subunit CAF16